jgi:hypothetical protein
MSDEPAPSAAHPKTLREVGFRECEHPLHEVQPFVDHSTAKFCLTCGATLAAPQNFVGWRRGVFHTDYKINYPLLERYGLVPAFEFWIRQRPDSRTFGDVT